MHRSLLEVLCCPGCRESLRLVGGGDALEVRAGALECTGCGRRFEVEEGIAVLGDREHMGKVSDSWPEGMLTQELYRRNIENSRQWYGGSEAFAAFVDAAAETKGVVVDIATGPGSSFAGALVPRLGAGTQFVMTDAAVHVLHGLKEAWEEEEHRALVDFVGCDGNRMPFADESVDAMTSQLGFACAQDDPTRSRPPTGGPAYRESHRILKRGGKVFDVCRLYAPESKTAACLESVGCVKASSGGLEQFWKGVGFEVVTATELLKRKGKSDPGDGLPIDENDEWSHVAYVLRKG